MQQLRQKPGQPTKSTPLRIVEHPNAFGAHLEFVRNRDRVERREVAEALPQYFKERSVTFPTSDPADMYRKTEKGIRATQFEELIPLYATLIGCGVTFSAEERHTYVRLARNKLETMQRKRPKTHPDSEWETLEAQLAKIDHQRQEGPAQNALDIALSENAFDVSHVVGRDDWLKTALSYLSTTPPKKLVVIQAMMGMGKTTCLKLLLHTLSEQDSYQPILHLFPDRQDMTSEDHLDTFLAAVLAKREVIIPESKMPSRHEQIRLLLGDLHKAKQRVMLLLDDAQIILDEHDQLPACWQDFFTEFLLRPHQAVIYLATRQWSMWPGRDPIYIVDGDAALLPPLDGEAGIEIWRRFGFGDVDAELRRRATERLGGNPRMIELRATAPGRRELPFAWEEWSETVPLSAPKSEHQELIEHLLEDAHLFGIADVEVQHLLEQVISQRISSDALPILEVLAVSPLALPIPLLVSVTPQARYALVELLNSSLLDQTAIANKRAGVQPLTREAILHTFLKEENQREAVERQVSQLYQIWMDQGTFRDELEQATLVAEAVILSIKHRQLLEAAELFMRFSWLCALFGQAGRVQRVFGEVVRVDRGKMGDENYNAGRILLFYTLQLVVGDRLDARARDRDFHVVRELCLAGKIVLQPSTEISLAHYLMRRMVVERRFQDAYDFLEGSFEHISTIGEISPEERASFLHSKSHLLGEWSNYAFETNQSQEVERLHNECVQILTEVIHTWRACIEKSLPLQKHHYQFKIAKALNDLAYYLRMLDRLEEAEQAIIECLDLKEGKKASKPGSLAISYGEYALILAAKGQFKLAEKQSDKAIEHINAFLALGGDSFAAGNKGTLLFERAQIYMRQARLDEAFQLAQEAHVLIKDNNRHSYHLLAKQLCDRIQVIQESSVRHQLDSEWYGEYHKLAQYNAISQLAQAGPFSSEEEQMWKELFPQYRDPAVWEQLARIIRQTREREFEQSLSRSRPPFLWHPAIDMDDINERMRGFASLKERIEQKEKNAVVRRLYVQKIKEDLLHLRLMACTYNHDVEGVRVCNEALYGRISQGEMAVALRELFVMLVEAEKHPQASEVAHLLLRQLKQWNLFAVDFLPNREESVKKGDPKKLQLWSETRVSPQVVQRFYEEIIREYGFTEWRIVLSADRDTPSPDPDLCVLHLPATGESTVLSVVELLAEEVETHMFRSVAGRKSKLALLGSGTCGYLPMEEGLAIYAVQEMMEMQGLGQKPQRWLSTLAPGLVQGILVPAHSFESLHAFLSKVILAGQLSTGRQKTVEGTLRTVQRIALRRAMRTFRGVPDLTVAGVCNAKERVYLQGCREATDALAKYPKKQLVVGAIGTQDLNNMEELHISKPAIEQLHLACRADVFERIIRLKQ